MLHNLEKLKEKRVRDIKQYLANHSDGFLALVVSVIYTYTLDDVANPKVSPIIQFGSVTPVTSGAGWNGIYLDLDHAYQTTTGHANYDLEKYCPNYNFSDKELATRIMTAGEYAYWFLIPVH